MNAEFGHDGEPGIESSVVLPCFEEEQCLPELLAELVAVLEREGLSLIHI